MKILLGLALVTVFGAGCAPRTATTGNGSAPSMLSATRPQWRTPSGSPTGVVLDLRISVRVDAAGRPDLETLEVNGLGATENREEAIAWVRSARFRPAQQAGQAIDGTFRTRVQARTQIRRERVPLSRTSAGRVLSIRPTSGLLHS